MKKLGRPRKTAPGEDKLPPGLRKIGSRYYWQPTSLKEKARRKSEGLPVSVALGEDLRAARKAWGKLQGSEFLRGESAGMTAELLLQFRDEYLVSVKRLPGGRTKPRYAPDTQRSYRWTIDNTLLPAFGELPYAKFEAEAALNPGALLSSMKLQAWISEQERFAEANRALAVLSKCFGCAKLWGKTTYNPCIGVERLLTEPRGRDVEPWEVQALLVAAELCSPKLPPLPDRRPGEPNRPALCACGCGGGFELYDSQDRARRYARGHSSQGAHNGRMLSLMVRFADASGASGQDCRGLRREHATARGVAITRGKTGTRRVTAWSDEMRDIIAQALDMGPPVRGAIFCNRKGGAFSATAFQQAWKKLIRRARRLTAEAGLPALLDLKFHDIRKKAGNDAMEQGQEMHEFLGNTKEVARTDYKLRPTLVRPTK